MKVLQRFVGVLVLALVPAMHAYSDDEECDCDPCQGDPIFHQRDQRQAATLSEARKARAARKQMAVRRLLAKTGKKADKEAK